MPAASAQNWPVDPTAPTDGVPLDQVPPAGPVKTLTQLPVQTGFVILILSGRGFTVTVLVTLHPVLVAVN